MQWVLSTILGLIIAWVILAFVGPVQPRTSYYVQQPVAPTPLSDLDKIMEAVGLQPSCTIPPAPSPTVMPPPEVPKSVADIATVMPSPAPMMPVMPAPAPAEPADQGTPAIPQPAAPAPGPAPVSP